MRIPDPKANTTTEAYLAYKAGYLEESELKPVLYEPYLHFDAWLAYWAGLTSDYPHNVGKNLFNVNGVSVDVSASLVVSENDITANMTTTGGNKYSVIEIPNSDGLLGKTVTLSYVLKNVSGGNSARLSMYFGKLSSPTQNTIFDGFVKTSSSVGETVEKTVTIPSSFPTSGQSIFIVVYANTNNTIVSTMESVEYSNIQLEVGSTATSYEPYNKTPEMLTDEEALVAYLSGVTDTYPEEIKDPYDVRIVGYLKHLASIRWPEPDYPVNNEEFYLSTMEPTHTSNPVPSSDIELNTVEGKIISVEAYGDTYQQTYSGKNLIDSTSTTYVYSNSPSQVTLTAIEGGIRMMNSGGESQGRFVVFKSIDLTSYTGKVVRMKATFGTSGGIRLYRIASDGSNRTQAASTTVSGNEISFTVPEDLGDLPYLGYVLEVIVGNNTTVDFTDLIMTVDAELEPFEPYVGGIPAPNPDYPQEIQTVTAEQTVEITGKNLVGYEAPFINAYFEVDGSQILASSANRIYYVPCRKDTTYTITTPATGAGTVFGGGCRVGVTNELPAIGVTVPTVVKYGTGMAEPSTYTTTAENAYFVVRIQAQTGSGLNLDQTAKAFFDACQIEIGSTATDYEPYQSQSYEINLGKNLFNMTNYTGNVTITGLNSFEANVDTARTANIFFSPRLPAGTYTLSYDVSKNSTNTEGIRCGVYVVDGSGTSSLGTIPQYDGHVEYTFTSTTEVDRVYFFINSAMPSGSTASVSNIQVEAGTSATSFAPYFTPIELCKIGDYQDYIYKSGDDWYVHKIIGEIISDGSEDWSIMNSGTPNFYYNLGGLLLGIDDNTQWLVSNYGVPGLISNLNTVQGIILTHANDNDYIRVRYGTEMSVENWKTKLSTSHMIVYYAHATATDTKITDATLVGQLEALAGADTYNEKTYIKVTATDPNLPALLKVEAYKY